MQSIPLQHTNQSQNPSYNNKDYFARRQLQYAHNGSLILNFHNIKLLCIKDGLYELPQLNSKLYLNCKAIEKLQNLDSYVNIKTLYLQNNVIKRIQGLEQLTNLQNLFLQNNMISQISGLEKNLELKNINLSNNTIFKIEKLEHLRTLQTLNLAHNYLKDYQSLQHLYYCSEFLTAIDLTKNQIVGDINILKLIPQVRLLYLWENPFCKQVAHYRKATVGTLKNLVHLDQNRVSPQQRIISEQFVLQGKQGAQRAHHEILQIKNQQKLQKKQQIMKDIDVHRQRKINVFKRDIMDLQKQIHKLKQQKKEEEDKGMCLYYKKQIGEREEQIHRLEQRIRSIEQRIRVPAMMENSKISDSGLLADSTNISETHQK